MTAKITTKSVVYEKDRVDRVTFVSLHDGKMKAVPVELGSRHLSLICLCLRSPIDNDTVQENPVKRATRGVSIIADV